MTRILTYPDPRLRKPATRWEATIHGDIAAEFGELRRLLHDVDRGAALAANQAGFDIRAFVVNMDLSASMERSIPELILNPEITGRRGGQVTEAEGCLSFPGIFVPVSRWVEIDVTFKTLHVGPSQMTFTGFWARVFQHEIDHLDGRLFIDNLDRRSRGKVLEKMTRRR